MENGDFKGKKEATWAVTNLTSGGSAMQVFKLVELGGLKPLCAMLGCADGKIVQVVLDGLTNMLNMADASGKTTEMTTCIEEADAIDMLEKLQEHENEVRKQFVALSYPHVLGHLQGGAQYRGNLVQ